MFTNITDKKLVEAEWKKVVEIPHVHKAFVLKHTQV